jgi:hypothetical protein
VPYPMLHPLLNQKLRAATAPRQYTTPNALSTVENGRLLHSPGLTVPLETRHTRVAAAAVLAARVDRVAGARERDRPMAMSPTEKGEHHGDGRRH